MDLPRGEELQRLVEVIALAAWSPEVRRPNCEPKAGKRTAAIFLLPLQKAARFAAPRQDVCRRRYGAQRSPPDSVQRRRLSFPFQAEEQEKLIACSWRLSLERGGLRRSAAALPLWRAQSVSDWRSSLRGKENKQSAGLSLFTPLISDVMATAASLRSAPILK